MESCIAHSKYHIKWGILKVIVVALVFMSFSFSAQYDDYYRNWEALLSESSPNLSVNFDGNHNAVLGSIYNQNSETSMNEKFTLSSSSLKKRRDTEMKDVNDWNYKPNELLASASLVSTLPPITEEGPGPKQLSPLTNEPTPQDAAEDSSWDYAFTNPFENIGSSDLKVNKVGHSEQRMKSQEDSNINSVDQKNLINFTELNSPNKMFLLLADEVAGTSLTTSPEQTHTLPAVPIKEGANRYTNSPTLIATPKPNLNNGESFAEAILRGQIKKWDWSYVSSAQKDKVGLPNNTSVSSEWIPCCHLLPYICSKDALCLLKSKICHEFCECAAYPAAPHCTTVIPEIERIMTIMEREMLIRLARKLRMTPPTDFTAKISEIKIAKKPTAGKMHSTTSFSDNDATTTEAEQSALMGSSPIQPIVTAVQNFTNTVASPWNLDGQSSDLVDIKQQKTFFSWFKSMSNDTVSPLTSTQVPEAQDATTNLTTIGNTDELTSTVSTNSNTIGHSFEFCSNDCEIKGGTCVMGNDFRPHCIIVASDACDHFHCVNGECVSDDGVYTCECGHGWAGTFCDIPCPLNCGQYGYCSVLGSRKTAGVGHDPRNASDIDNNKQESNSHTDNNNKIINNISADIVCICHWNRTGANCEATRKIVPKVYEFDVPSHDFHAWQVALISILFAVTLALVCGLAPYFLWRRSWLPMRKLVYYFQEYEDDDDKDFDAFVSYKSTPRDESFVLQHLYPKLEQELGFKLCLHFRDFPPGEAIANNIIQAVERSRRTILVLSPNYVSSEWCRLEYQKAQHEMLKLRHKIIPVILEDVRKVPEMDKALRTIIDTVTYIEWPGEHELSIAKNTVRNFVSTSKIVADLDRFWKLIACSMPKKRKVSSCDSSCHRGFSHDNNGLALTVVRASATTTAASQITQQSMSLSPLNSGVSSPSDTADTPSSCNKILDVQNEDLFSSQQSSYHRTHEFFENNESNLRRMAENISTNSESIYIITSNTDACQIQPKSLSTQVSNVSFSFRGSLSATLDTLRGSPYSTADNSLIVPVDNKTLMLKNHIPFHQKDPCTLFPLTKRTRSDSIRSSVKYQNSARFQGPSSNNSTAQTGENENICNTDINNKIQTPDVLFASKVLTDSGVESSGDGSCCSSTKEKVRSQHRAPHLKKLGEGNPSELENHKSSDDHIVEI